MKRVRENPFTLSIIALMALMLSSCVPNAGNSLRSRDNSGLITSANVSLYQGKILADNPIILSRNANLSDAYDLNKLLSVDTITSNSFLKGNTSCYGLTNCFEVHENKNSPSALQTSDGKWAFNAKSSEFLQVNTYYHLNKVFDLFVLNLSKSFSYAYNGSSTYYKTSLPLSLSPFASLFNITDQPLVAYANCDAADNAYFDHVTKTLCFGYISGHDNVKWAQDSTVIYHETGHFFQKFQLNIRNSSIPSKADMGNLNYDEAGSIGEGLSDFYSYYVNGRTHFAEWAAGRFLNASRPMTETDPLHSAPLSNDADQRLRYPDFLNYNPNSPTTPTEDVHNSGMIMSHFLTALTNDLESSCSMDTRGARDLITHLITETLAELGDLNSNGIEGVFSGTRVNLNSTYAYDWLTKVNPINYRSFMQTFAKNLKNNLGSSLLNRCNGGVYSNDQIESIIDQYGLLLFRTYNENKNLSNPGVVNNTAVNATNRKKTVLISKNLLSLDPATNATTAYVIDDKASIQSGIISLQSSGMISSTFSKQSDLGFNNNNGKVSPGEIVAIVPNLYNNSNSIMGGIQVLANDWNHADSSGKPCRFGTTMSNDQWPLTSEGGVPCTTVSATIASDFAPVCFVQSNESNATKWVSQKDFKTKMALDTSLCLDPNNDKDCFIRAVKGADQANYSKLNQKSTWIQTMADSTSGKAPKFSFGNSILFEVSKQIPPGTIFDCRLRVRFSNCDECYHDSTRSNYDYTDTDYNGPRPFKVIHLQIPVTD